MSLFENDQYRWRETYFVLFRAKDRPSAEAMREALTSLGGRYEISDVREDGAGHVESLSLISPHDFAAMDISYVSGEDVQLHLEELKEELRGADLTEQERRKLKMLPDCDARYDIYHFEQVVEDDSEDDEEFLDPGSLLIVLEKLARLCRGIGIDPQSGTVM